VNAIRMAHNPPASGLLDLTDKMGFLVVDEIFDSWNLNKTDNDFHLIFPDWHEQDLRSMIRRDRNHPSIISWSFGNEVGEQRFPEELAEIATLLHGIVREEDPTRPSTASMNVAQPGNDGAAFPEIMDVLSINYQGEGIRDTPNYSGTNGTRTPPAYGIFHQDQPEKLIWTSESASALSTRGTFFFPVTDNRGAPVNETSGGNETLAQVSAYELYSANFGSSPDKVFATQDRNPYVGGEFVWTGFDYIGEPTPYYTSRSSYSGIVDLAGFKKERFYLYQARWRPELPMVHILPHWNWPDRVGEVTPVHVFTSGDEAELFLNGKSMGRQRKQPFEYRLRWDDVIYERGELHVVSYKDGNPWANASVLTTGPAAAVRLTADRESISADGRDLLYVTADVVDAEGLIVPTADNLIEISVSGAGQIVATDNGDPADLVAFPSTSRKAFSGRALVILKCAGGDGMIRVSALSVGLSEGDVTVGIS
jgi:beta-galactosidase